MEAGLDSLEITDLARMLGDEFGVLFVALSYRWLSRGDPDPDGFHLAAARAPELRPVWADTLEELHARHNVNGRLPFYSVYWTTPSYTAINGVETQLHCHKWCRDIATVLYIPLQIVRLPRSPRGGPRSAACA